MKSYLVCALVLLSGLLQARDQPNILWIFSEDLSPYFGCYDDPINAGHTPSIDQLAADGVLFKRTFMPAPVCSAARSAMITGVMQTTTGTHQHRSSRSPDGKGGSSDTESRSREASSITGAPSPFVHTSSAAASRVHTSV